MNNRKIRLATTVLCAAYMIACMADCSLIENIYAGALNVYSGHPNGLTNYFYAVKGGGLCSELTNEDFQKFYALRDSVSNNCAQIAADWRTYETNDIVRYTTLCAIAHSGYDNMTNAAMQIIQQYAANTNYCSWATVRFLYYTEGTPSEEYLAMHYEQPAVSNLLETIRAKAYEIGDTNTWQNCQSDLKGETKMLRLEMGAAGLLE